MKLLLYRLFAAALRIKRRMLMRFTRPGLFVLACMGISAVIGLDTNQTVAYRIFTFLFCLMTISLAFVLRFRTESISVTRNLPAVATAGEPLTYRLRFENRGRRIQKGLLANEVPEAALPNFRDFATTREPGYDTRNRFDRLVGYPRWLHLLRSREMIAAKEHRLPDVPPGGTGECRITVVPARRGILRLTAICISRPDPFGLVKAFHRVASAQSLTVLPRRFVLPHIPLPGSRRYQSGGVAQAGSVGDSEEFVSLRDYRPGDPLRRIHWRTWARIGQPVVKEYQDEFFVRHALVLDTFLTVGGSERFEAAVSLAASFALTVQTQDSLLDLMFIGLEAYCFTAGRGVGNAEKMLEILASVPPCPVRDFRKLTPLVMARAPGMTGLILILLDWDTNRQALVRQLRHRGLPVLVVVVMDAPPTEPLEPGPLADAPDRFKVVSAERMEADLARAFSYQQP